jgi:hypothetical protein
MRGLQTVTRSTAAKGHYAPPAVDFARKNVK